MKNTKGLILLFCLALIAGNVSVNAQAWEFTYQGSLKDNGQPANGTYDFEFRLFDTLAAGSQQGPTITLNNIAVTNGVFKANLNFGPLFFGPDRFVDIKVKASGGGSFTPLLPRERIKSAPFAYYSHNAGLSQNSVQLGGVNSSQYVITSDIRLTDQRNPLPGSGNYIQNSSTAQPSSDFNISGTGRANIFRASTQFNIGAFRVLTRNSAGLFIGDLTGASTSGDQNIFVGEAAGNNSLQASENSLFGFSAGSQNRTGNRNTFIGHDAGKFNTTGNDNTMLGNGADVASSNLSFATAIGAESSVSSSNTVVLGRSADRVSIPGTATIGNQTTNYGQLNINASSTNANLYMSGDGATKGINFGVDSTTTAEPKLFISQYNGTTYLDRLTINDNGEVGINILGQGGSTALCRNSLNHISTCSSSARYKTNIQNYRSGLSLIRKLRPVSFNWTEGGMSDVGLVAEEVAAAEPLLTTTVDGKTEGVKYDRLGVVLINAVQEQQVQIESGTDDIEKLKAKIAAQQAEIDKLKARDKEFDELKALICSTNKTAEICK